MAEKFYGREGQHVAIRTMDNLQRDVRFYLQQAMSILVIRRREEPDALDLVRLEQSLRMAQELMGDGPR